MIVCYYIQVRDHDDQIWLEGILRRDWYAFIDMTDQEPRCQLPTLEEVEKAS